jgi:arsenite oxidase small subunit
LLAIVLAVMRASGFLLPMVARILMEHTRMDTPDLNRRSFVKACGAVAALSAASAGRLTQPAFALADAPKLKLVDKAGKPIKASALEVDANHIFLYPHVSTPCLLLRLGNATPRNVERKDADGAAYSWPGGVGKDRAVVAYSAICAHTFSYDSKQTSFLTYSKARTQVSAHSRAITCCAHASVYDPAEGAKVLSGPAGFPLAAVQFEYHADTDELTAIGLIGTTLFGEFFKAYRAELNAEFGRGAYRALIEAQTTVLPIQDYSKDIVHC